MSASYSSTPVVLTSGLTPLSFTVASGIASAPQQFSAVGLVNPLNAPIELTEIYFVAACLPGGGGVDTIPPSSLEVRLGLGSYSITPDFTPIIALGPQRRVDNDGERVNNGSYLTIAIETNYSLPRPALMLPGEALSGYARISPLLAASLNNATVTLSMCARGRRLDSAYRAGQPRSVPYASGYFFTAPGVPAPDTVFRNQLAVPLNVSSINANPAAGFFDLAGTISIDGPGGLARSARRTLAQSAPAGPTFGGRNSLEVGHVLNPGEFYYITMSTPVPTFALAPYNNGYPGTAVVMSGWREEA